MKGKDNEIKINESQKRFCESYIFDWNATRAYKEAYPESSVDAARSSASDLLSKPNIQAYLESIQKDIEKQAGISRIMVIREHQKLAFSSIANLHNTWITRKEFEELTEDQKSCIAEIQTQTRTEKDYSSNQEGDTVQIDYVKIKLYDKQKSLDSISKMLGYNEPEKMVHDLGTIKSFTINAASGRKQGS